MSVVKLSPATRIDRSVTIPPREITAISDVPPPISIIMFPFGSKTSIPIPIAAAIGSCIKKTSFAPACSAESFTALFSTSVIPEGIQTTIFNEGEKRLFLLGIILIIPLIICSAAEKSAITPSFKGRIVCIVLWVLPCINWAFFPIATTLFRIISFATIEGSSTTTLSLWMISVFAVPKSIAISCVMKSKNPIF